VAVEKNACNTAAASCAYFFLRSASLAAASAAAFCAYYFLISAARATF
jgi:hypothetical protein